MNRHERRKAKRLDTERDRKYSLTRPIEEFRDDPDVSREHFLALELIAVSGDDGMSDREGEKFERELLFHFNGDVEAALAAFASGDVSLANGSLLIGGQRPHTVNDIIQSFVAEGILAPTGTYRLDPDGKLRPVYALTNEGRAEHLRFTEAKGNG
jgi:hypothetical protein